MCEFASFVVTIDRVYWLPRSDSHEDIVQQHGLHADGARGPNIVRVELRPVAGSMDDLSGWVYRVDQDILPEWHAANPVETEARVIATAATRREIDPQWWRV